MRSFYEKHFLTAEMLAGLLAAFAFVVLTERSIWWTGQDALGLVVSHAAGLYEILTSVGVTLLGFILTAVSIVLAWTGLERFEILRRSEHFATLFVVFFSAIKWLALLSGLAFAGLFVGPSGKLGLIVIYALVAVGMVTVLRVWRCVWALQWITRIGTTEKAD